MQLTFYFTKSILYYSESVIIITKCLCGCDAFFYLLIQHAHQLFKCHL